MIRSGYLSFMMLFAASVITFGQSSENLPEGMVLVDGGVFEMGDVFSVGDEDEFPVRTVRVNSFFMDEAEVTVAEYRAFAEETNREMPHPPPWGWVEDHPMVMVSWEEATNYAKWAGKRLPTEAEWEYAAREGGKKLQWSGTNDSTELKEYGWYGDKAVGALEHKEREVGNGSTRPVMEKKPNVLGLYDMSGNVWEWTSNWYSKENPGDSGEVIDNPQGPEDGIARTVRGGSWFGFAVTLRNPNRWYFGFKYVREDDIGFRCVMDVPGN
jgi:formylglycine-generating enzyme required for sulfatase activity